MVSGPGIDVLAFAASELAQSGAPRLCRGGLLSLTVPEIEETPSREPLKASRESQMSNYRKLQHTEWDCKYHVIFIPEYRRKVLYGMIRAHLGEIFQRLARQKACEIEEGHLSCDHVHMMISIPPKHSVAQVVGYIKGKSAIHIARQFSGRRRNCTGQHFLARGYFVSTVGRDEEVIRQYIQN